ncbi:Hypothetical predicted protein [Pelobates cultripes]|uniref:Uncharacterized protein n=1 Tax=Pelobates cultripes TaxID=61616 RepID=A0AAD1VNH8_PELCU|nr:Hypothetical predicted protein [Pelobates cultripes]
MELTLTLIIRKYLEKFSSPSPYCQEPRKALIATESTSGSNTTTFLHIPRTGKLKRRPKAYQSLTIHDLEKLIGGAYIHGDSNPDSDIYPNHTETPTRDAHKSLTLALLQNSPTSALYYSGRCSLKWPPPNRRYPAH